MLSLLYLFGFCSLFLWHSQCCECWVGMFMKDFPFVYIRLCCSKRGVRGHLFNWLILSHMLWQSKCYLQPHCTGRMLSHTFHVEDGKSKMEIWLSAATSGNETNFERCVYPQQQWDVPYVFKTHPGFSRFSGIFLGFYCYCSPLVREPFVLLWWL